MTTIALVTHLKQVAQAAKAYTDSLISETAKETIKEEYPMRYDITAADVTATDRADIILSPNSLTAAMDCGVCQTCETQAGKICIWAKKAPAEALTAEYRIIQGEKPKEE